LLQRLGPATERLQHLDTGSNVVAKQGGKGTKTAPMVSFDTATERLFDDAHLFTSVNRVYS